MATSNVKFTQPFLYSDVVGGVVYTLKVDQSVAQLNGFINETVAGTLIGLDLAYVPED